LEIESYVLKFMVCARIDSGMSVSPIPIANEFVDRFGGDGNITHMKLQKLLYFANGWWLGLSGERLLSENPQVWRYGPVFRGVYNAFNRFGSRSVTGMVQGNPFAGNQPQRLSAEEKQRVEPMINWIWGEYGGRTGIQLSDETHAPGTPWQCIAAANNYSVPLETEIDPKEDWRYFAQLASSRGWKPAEYKA
jgi:uncharacterized phage-associated protein